jgi:hypothetical protein
MLFQRKGEVEASFVLRAPQKHSSSIHQQQQTGFGPDTDRSARAAGTLHTQSDRPGSGGIPGRTTAANVLSRPHLGPCAAAPPG